jgi:ribosomal protein S18 acetylase RimI-like enzyme
MGRAKVNGSPCRKEAGLTAEIIDIRHFEVQDLQALLDTESQLWEEELRWDFSSSARIISACLAEKRLSGYALLKAGQVAGYSFFIYESFKGLIGDLFVDRQRASPEDWRMLLEHVLETILATPGLKRVEAQLPHFSVAEMGAEFQKHGFEVYPRRFMALHLGQRPAADATSNNLGQGLQDFSFEPWVRRHDTDAAKLLFETYRHHVDARINDQYLTVPGSSRLIESILHFHGCGEILPGLSQAAIHLPTRRLAGVLALTGVRPGTAHIPQIAVAEEYQGRGLGRAMMEHGFRELARRGFQEVTLTVTNGNAGAVSLYERMGFRTFRIFGAYVWQSQD